MSNLFNFFFEKVGYYMKCGNVISMAYTKKTNSNDNPNNEFQEKYKHCSRFLKLH